MKIGSCYNFLYSWVKNNKVLYWRNYSLHFLFVFWKKSRKEDRASRLTQNHVAIKVHFPAPYFWSSGPNPGLSYVLVCSLFTTDCRFMVGGGCWGNTSNPTFECYLVEPTYNLYKYGNKSWSQNGFQSVLKTRVTRKILKQCWIRNP